jgi:hypothetical protein
MSVRRLRVLLSRRAALCRHRGVPVGQEYVRRVTMLDNLASLDLERATALLTLCQQLMQVAGGQGGRRCSDWHRLCTAHSHARTSCLRSG